MTRDDEWHGIMLSACPNGRLLALIASVRQSLHRYESLLVSDQAIVARVAAEHSAIAECLASGDIAGAQQALRANWVNGAKRVLLPRPVSTCRPEAAQPASCSSASSCARCARHLLSMAMVTSNSSGSGSRPSSRVSCSR